MSHFSSGTLGSTLQYRKGPGGSIAITAPRPRKTIPLALRSNAEIVRQAWALMKNYNIQNALAYVAYAKLNSITPESAYLHFCLKRWRAWTMIPYEDPDTYNDAEAGEPTLSIDLSAPADTPNIVVSPWVTDDYLTIHILFSDSEIPGPKNCFHAHSFIDQEMLLNTPSGFKGAFYLQAASWKIEGSVPTLSNKLLITV
jgi:hypothetical protein